MLAICQSSGVFDFGAFEEGYREEGEIAFCRAQRAPGGKLVERSFSVADAKKAGLWSKSGPWTQYPRRMLQMRARSFALRDVFADVLKGTYSHEEMVGVDPQNGSTVTAELAPGTQKKLDQLADTMDAGHEAPGRSPAEAVPAPEEMVEVLFALRKVKIGSDRKSWNSLLKPYQAKAARALTESQAAQLIAKLSSMPDLEDEHAPADAHDHTGELVTQEQLRQISTLADQSKMTNEDWMATLAGFGIENLAELRFDDAVKFISALSEKQPGPGGQLFDADKES